MSEEWLYFIDGWFLTFTFYALAIGLGIRVIIFISTLIKSRIGNNRSFLDNGMDILQLVARAFIPFHKGVVNKPFYTGLRYIFHACLFIVPVWYSGHIYMISDSSLEWYWEPIADEHIDSMTFLVIGIGLFFLARRLIIPTVRQASSVSDVVFILVTILPFATGYWYVYGTLDDIPILGGYMWYLHVFTGELMLLMAVFLFVRTKLLSSRCVGCSSCVEACPTGTLEAKDNGTKRIFLYSHYQCICCGACTVTCPEQAAILRHEISFYHYFSFFKKQKIREKELVKCLECNELFAPDRQLEKIQNLIRTNGVEPPLTLAYCRRCKKLFSNHIFHA